MGMEFEGSGLAENIGKIAGFLASYFIFTVMLFLMLTLLKKIPEGWNHFHIAVITCAVAITGWGIRKWLRS